jgi:hypothetical protein
LVTPSGRLIGQREPSSFDLGEVLRVAREEGCAMELDSQADRLDLTDTACLSAKHAGVKIVISIDAHHPHEFSMLEIRDQSGPARLDRAIRRAEHASAEQTSPATLKSVFGSRPVKCTYAFPLRMHYFRHPLLMAS